MSESPQKKDLDTSTSLDLSQPSEKEPVVMENWPVAPEAAPPEADDTQKIGQGQPASIQPDDQAGPADDETGVQSFISTDPANLKAAVRVADNKEVELTTQDGQPVFAEAREKQRRRVEELRRTHTEEERDSP